VLDRKAHKGENLIKHNTDSEAHEKQKLILGQIKIRFGEYMAITLKRQLNEGEKEIILKRHGRVCFANGHQIPSEDKVHFDHIRAFALDGQSEPDLRILNQANISAHDKFAQTRFFSSVLILKLGNQFGKDFDEYKNKEDIEKKTESGFLQFLEDKDVSLTRAERNKRFRSYLYKSILEDESNKLKSFISTSNRSSNEQPLTVDMLSKSILSCFLYTDPLSDDMFSDKYRRESEFKNVIALMNMLYELALHSWNPKATSNDQAQIRLNRIFSSKSIMAWSELFRDAVCAKLEIHESDEKEKPFYRDFTDSDFGKIKSCLSRLLNWQMWSAPKDTEIDTAIAGSKSNLKEWFKNKGLTTGFIMGAPE